jgi:hypothetical protein
MDVSFIGEENWNTPTCRELLTNFITSGTETAYPEFTPGA